MPEAAPTAAAAPPQPEPQYVITALQDEIVRLQNEMARLGDNRIYLVAVINQVKAEFAQAQEMWQMERESLLKAQDNQEG